MLEPPSTGLYVPIGQRRGLCELMGQYDPVGQIVGIDIPGLLQ